MSLCHVCCLTHTATENSVTIWFQQPGDTRASPTPSAITRSEFKHQLSWTQLAFIFFFFSFFNNSGLSLREERGR